jgi:hypothetical protein
LRSLFDRDLNENDQSKLQASRISNKISWKCLCRFFAYSFLTLIEILSQA